MYCVIEETFQFDPSKVKSIKEAYDRLDDYNGSVQCLFDSLEEARNYVGDSASFHGYDYKSAIATVYVIDECEWYFDDEHYRNDETGEIERTYDDLMTLGFQYVITDEAAFKAFKYGVGIEPFERDFKVLAEFVPSYEYNKHGHICLTDDGDVFLVESDDDVSAPMYELFDKCCCNLDYDELDRDDAGDMSIKVYIKDVGYKTISEVLSDAN